MKKFILFLFVFNLSYFFVSAQHIQEIKETKKSQTAIYSENGEFVGYVFNKKVLNYPKHIFGLRAGALLTKAKVGSFFDEYNSSTKFCAGAHLGGTYEIALSRTHRWFFQTGLDFQFSRLKVVQTEGMDMDMTDISLLDDQSSKTKALYMEIPIMFSCKFQLGKHCGIYPSLGFAYAVGLWATTDTVVYEGSGRYGSSYDKRHEKYDGFSQENYNYLSRHVVNAKAELNFTCYNALIGVGTFYAIFGQQWGLSFNLGYNF